MTISDWILSLVGVVFIVAVIALAWVLVMMGEIVQEIAVKPVKQLLRPRDPSEKLLKDLCH